jgi:hypothetical protein
MKPLVRTLIVSSLVLATGAASAGPRYHGHVPRHHHHHHHRGPGLGGLVLGLAVAVPLIALAQRAERAPEVVYVPQSPAPQPPAPVYEPSRAAPVIYPRHGQGPAQLEDDHRDCNRWATTQPAAMADAGVFQRAVEACMDGRGYTLR